jgi:hypothetical protein
VQFRQAKRDNIVDNQIHRVQMRNESKNEGN